jgi:hypothetical protein
MTTTKEAIIETVLAQLRADLHDKFAAICEAAEESFKADEEAPAPKAKVTVSIAFSPLAAEQDVELAMAWAARYKVAHKLRVDPNQEKLSLGAAEGGAQ